MTVQVGQRRFEIEYVTFSAKYLLYGILLGFFRIFWLVGKTSQLFGSPPPNWIETVSNMLTVTMFAYMLVGILFLMEAYRRMGAGQNEPVSPLILNTVGVVLMWVFTVRVANVLDSSPLQFVTWSRLLVNGTIQGGVYALIALGYTLVYGILFMINFAHGEVVMFGAYAGYLSMQFLISGGDRSFEDGATVIATFIVPFAVGVMFLPVEKLFTGYTNRKTANFQTPDWLFTFFSTPIRFAVGYAVGYGAFVGLGGYAPHVYLVVITAVGVLFAMACGMFVSMMLSIALESVAYRPLRKAPRLAPLISAIGASIFLQQVALRIFGGNRQAYPNPRLLSNPTTFDVSLGRLGVLGVSKVGTLIVITSILLMLLLYVIVQRTKMGKAMRAVAQDKSTAALMGINVDRVIVFTFMLGAALGGAAGVMLGLRSEKIYFKFGFLPGLKAFTAAVLGGIGSIPGAMFGGFFLGIVEALGPNLLGFGDQWKDAIAFGLLVLVLIFRPSGIFGAASEIKKV